MNGSFPITTPTLSLRHVSCVGFLELLAWVSVNGHVNIIAHVNEVANAARLVCS